MDNVTENTPDVFHQASGDQLPENDLFERIKTYPFDADPEFAKGLSILLGHPETSASDAEINREDDLVLQAKCFYFSKKEKLTSPINFGAYKAWLKSEPYDMAITASDQPTGLSTSGEDPALSGTQRHSQEPSYPSSFAHIVELITTGQPIPGILDIPDTVLTGHDTASTKPRRRKPWEAEGGQETVHNP